MDNADAISKLIDRVSATTTKLGWKELEDMIVDQTNGFSKTDRDSVFLYETYLMRVANRIKYYDKPLPFNTVHLCLVDEEEGIRILNYDFKTYCWAKNNKLDERLDNNVIQIKRKELNNSVWSHFKDIATNNYVEEPEEEELDKKDPIEEVKAIFGEGVEEIK